MNNFWQRFFPNRYWQKLSQQHENNNNAKNKTSIWNCAALSFHFFLGASTNSMHLCNSFKNCEAPIRMQFFPNSGQEDFLPLCFCWFFFLSAKCFRDGFIYLLPKWKCLRDAHTLPSKKSLISSQVSFCLFGRELALQSRFRAVAFHYLPSLFRAENASKTTHRLRSTVP